VSGSRNRRTSGHLVAPQCELTRRHHDHVTRYRLFFQANVKRCITSSLLISLTTSAKPKRQTQQHKQDQDMPSHRSKLISLWAENSQQILSFCLRRSRNFWSKGQKGRNQELQSTTFSVDQLFREVRLQDISSSPWREKNGLSSLRIWACKQLHDLRICRFGARHQGTSGRRSPRGTNPLEGLITAYSFSGYCLYEWIQVDNNHIDWSDSFF